MGVCDVRTQWNREDGEKPTPGQFYEVADQNQKK